MASTADFYESLLYEPRPATIWLWHAAKATQSTMPGTASCAGQSRFIGLIVDLLAVNQIREALAAANGDHSLDVAVLVHSGPYLPAAGAGGIFHLKELVAGIVAEVDGRAVRRPLQGAVGLRLKVKQDIALKEMLRRGTMIL